MYEIEVTDTFGGEANYCWVKRGTTKCRSRRGLIAAAKKLAGHNQAFIPHRRTHRD